MTFSLRIWISLRRTKNRDDSAGARLDQPFELLFATNAISNFHQDSLVSESPRSFRAQARLILYAQCYRGFGHNEQLSS